MELVPGTYSQLTAVLLESKEVWGMGFSAGDYLKLNLSVRKHPWSKKHFRHLVLLDKVKSIRSSVKVFEQQAVLRGETVRVAQISELFTPKAQRKRGFAKAAMQMLLELLAEEGYAFAVSFPDSSGLPDSFGFRLVENQPSVFDMMIPAEPRRKVSDCRHKIPESVRSLHRQNNSSAFHIDRDAEYWDMLRFRRTMSNRLQWDRGRETLTMCEDGSAYAWTLWTGEHLEIMDAACEHPDGLADIFAHLFQRHGSAIVKDARGFLSPAFERLPFVKASRHEPSDNSIMAVRTFSGCGMRSLRNKSRELQVCALDRL